MSRIDSGKINFGSSYVLPTSDEQLKAQEIVSAKKVALELIEKAKRQAQLLLEEAQKKAQQHIDKAVEEANAKVAEITEDARQQGHQKGYEEGQIAIKRDLVEQIENLDKFAKSEFEIKKRIIKSAHNDIVNLVVTIADKVCHKKLKIDREILYNITKHSINELKDKETVTIFVNPTMAKKIYAISDDLQKDILSLKAIRIVEDSSVSEDGTIVESISSRIDNRISSQIDEITQKLLVELQSIDEDKLVSEIEKNK